MIRYFSLHVEAAKSALIRLIKQPFGSLLTLLMLAVSLTLPLALYLATQSFQAVVGQLSASPQITLFMELNADEADNQGIQAALKKIDGIAKVEFVSKASALDDLQTSMGEQDLINVLEVNPLPDAFVITPSSLIPDEVKALQNTLAQLPMVEQALVDTEWLNTLYQMNQFAHKVVWFLAATLSMAFILVAHNTIRLQVLSQRDEIEITKLLGASSAFIRRPFLYQAWWQGLLATLISLVLCAWLMTEITPLLSEMLKPYGIALSPRYFDVQELIVILAMMTLLAILGAYLATKQLMHSKQI